MTTYEKIIEYFKENEDIFNSCIEELDNYNGYLGDDRYYEMYMLDDFYQGENPIKILQRAYFGYDDDSCHRDSAGVKHRGEFNPNRDYFTYNGYGNLVSTDYPDYTAYLDEHTIDAMSNNRRWIDTIDDSDELSALFDELEGASNEKE